jgi:hypothetical protein
LALSCSVNGAGKAAAPTAPPMSPDRKRVLRRMLEGFMVESFQVDYSFFRLPAESICNNEDLTIPPSFVGLTLQNVA